MNSLLLVHDDSKKSFKKHSIKSDPHLDQCRADICVSVLITNCLLGQRGLTAIKEKQAALNESIGTQRGK
jgi:hypothetical protein